MNIENLYMAGKKLIVLANQKGCSFIELYFLIENSYLVVGSKPYGEENRTHRVKEEQRLVLTIIRQHYTSSIISNFSTCEELPQILECVINLCARNKEESHQNTERSKNNRQLIKQNIIHSHVFYEEKVMSKCIEKLQYSFENLQVDSYRASIEKKYNYHIYMNSHGIVDSFYNAFNRFMYDINKVDSNYRDISHYKTDDELISEIHKLENKDFKRLNTIQFRDQIKEIILSPEIICRLVTVPMNQYLNINNHSSKENSYIIKLPKIFTLCDMPIGINSLINTKFDLSGISLKNITFIKNGELLHRIGNEKDDMFKIVKGYGTIKNGMLSLSLHQPWVVSGTLLLSNTLRKTEKVLIARRFEGNVNIFNNLIFGKLCDIEVYSYGELIGKYKDIEIKLDYDIFVNRLRAVFKETKNVYDILYSKCPYVEMEI